MKTPTRSPRMEQNASKQAAESFVQSFLKMEHALRIAVRMFGMRESTYFILAPLYAHGRLPFIDIQRELGMDKAQLSRKVDALTEDPQGALIIRKSNKNDKRKDDVLLTPRGRHIFKEIHQQMLALFENIPRDELRGVGQKIENLNISLRPQIRRASKKWKQKRENAAASIP